MVDKTQINFVNIVQSAFLSDGPMTVDFRAVGYLATEDRDNEDGPTVIATWSLADKNEKSRFCATTRPTKVVHIRLGDITSSAILL